MQSIEDGRAACETCRWGDAWRLLVEVDLDALAVDDLDRRATAAFLIGQHEDAYDCWTRAHQVCVAEGSVQAMTNTRIAAGQSRRRSVFMDAPGMRNAAAVRLPG